MAESTTRHSLAPDRATVSTLKGEGHDSEEKTLSTESPKMRTLKGGAGESDGKGETGGNWQRKAENPVETGRRASWKPPEDGKRRTSRSPALAKGRTPQMKG